MDTSSGANAPAPPRGRLMEVPESLSLPRKAVPLGKVAANAVSRRKGCLPGEATSSCDTPNIYHHGICNPAAGWFVYKADRHPAAAGTE